MTRALLLVALFCSTASADERATTVTVAGTAGALERTNVDSYEKGVGGARLSLAWEHAPVAMPAQPGFAVGVDLVPEIVGGTLFESERAESFLGVGLRGELKCAQREMGLLRVSARFATYVAARGLVLGKDREAFGEFVLGEYFLLGQGRTRIGFEAGALVGKQDMMDEFQRRNGGGLVSLYIGWVP